MASLCILAQRTQHTSRSDSCQRLGENRQDPHHRDKETTRLVRLSRSADDACAALQTPHGTSSSEAPRQHSEQRLRSESSEVGRDVAGAAHRQAGWRPCEHARTSSSSPSRTKNSRDASPWACSAVTSSGSPTQTEDS